VLRLISANRSRFAQVRCEWLEVHSHVLPSPYEPPEHLSTGSSAARQQLPSTRDQARFSMIYLIADGPEVEPPSDALQQKDAHDGEHRRYAYGDGQGDRT
jgi:hypothetical protein